MPLQELKLNFGAGRLPDDVRSFLANADSRIRQFQRTKLIPGFVPSDFVRAYAVLRALAAAELAPGNLFCEWGSGFGVVACLAAQLDFEAYGIEIEHDLVHAARELADDFGLAVEFICGSFIPRGGEHLATAAEGLSWLTTDGSGTHEELGITPDTFDVIFAYPWPDEEEVILNLFDHYAGPGAILVSHHADGDFFVRRKTEVVGGGKKKLRQKDLRQKHNFLP